MEQMEWMLGMTQNMMNIAESSGMDDMYQMTSVMMGNLNHMKMLDVDGMQMGYMESMMRSMEHMMQNMNMADEGQKAMMASMMQYMMHMQMMTINMCMMC